MAASGRGRSRLSEGREARLEGGRGGGGVAPIPIPPGSIERKRAPPVGSVETKRKEMVRGNGEGEGEGCGRQEGDGKSTASC